MPLPVSAVFAWLCIARRAKPQSPGDVHKAAQHRTPTGDDLKIVGLDYVLLNDYPDAIKWLEKAVEAEPKNKEAWYFLGRAYYTKSSIPEARKHS